MKRAISLVLAAAGMFVANCALAGPPYNVDDPGTLRAGWSRITTSYVSSELPGSETQSFPSVSWRYGLTDNLEIKPAFGGISKRSSMAERVTGLADSSLTVKWRFMNETKSRPQTTLGYLVKAPTASSIMKLGTGRTDNKIWLTSGKSIKRYTAYANIGYTFMGDTKYRNSTYYGAVVTYQAMEKLIVGAQLYGNTSTLAGKPDELAWGLGMAYTVAPGRSVLLQMGRSLHGLSDLNAYVGYSFGFK